MNSSWLLSREFLRVSETLLPSWRWPRHFVTHSFSDPVSPNTFHTFSAAKSESGWGLNNFHRVGGGYISVCVYISLSLSICMWKYVYMHVYISIVRIPKA